MKKLLLSLALTLVGVGAVCAEEAETNAETLYKLSFAKDNCGSGTNSYSSSFEATCDDVVWTVSGLSNNGNTWEYVKVGKNSYEGSIVNKEAWSDNITEVVFNVSGTSKCCGKATLTVLDEEGVTLNEYDLADSFNAISSTASDIKVAIEKPGAFYKFYIKSSDSKNGKIIIYSVTYNGVQSGDVVVKNEAKVTFGEDASDSYTVNLSEASQFVAPTATTNSNGTITYASDNEKVATVDAKGVVTIVGIGTANITASVAATDSYKSAKASYAIKVVDDLPAEDGVFDFSKTFDIEVDGGEFPEVGSNGYNLGTLSRSGIDIEFSSGSNSSNSPRLWSSNDGMQVRVYQGNKITFTCSSKKRFTGITFTGMTSASVNVGTFKSGIWTCGEETATAIDEEVADNEVNAGEDEVEDDVEISGDANSSADAENIQTVVFTVSSTSKITKIAVTLDTASAVEEIAAENAEAVYYNLQGVRVANPEQGLYIRVQGNKASKVVM